MLKSFTFFTEQTIFYLKKFIMQFHIKIEHDSKDKPILTHRCNPNNCETTNLNNLQKSLNLKSAIQKLVIFLLLIVSLGLFIFNIILVLPYLLGSEKKLEIDNENHQIYQGASLHIDEEDIRKMLEDRLDDHDPDNLKDELNRNFDKQVDAHNINDNLDNQLENQIGSPLEPFASNDNQNNNHLEDGPVLEYAQRKYYPYKLNPRNLCRNKYDNSREPVYLLLVIKSVTSQFARRHAIRKTWGDTHQIAVNIEQTGFSGRTVKENLLKNTETVKKISNVEQNDDFLSKFSFLNKNSKPTKDPIQEVDNHHDQKQQSSLQNTVAPDIVLDTQNSQPIIIKRLFLLADSGNKHYEPLVEQEYNEYHDILQGDFLDSFRNLTLKDIMFLNWQQVYCPQVQFIFKGDDDVFVNVFNILRYIESQPKEVQTQMFTGSVLYPSPRITDPRSKYYVSSNLWSEKYYPPYVSGGGFIMSSYVAAQIFEVMKLLPIIPIDDAFVGICLDKIGIRPINHKGFKSWGLRRGSKDICVFRDVMTLHKLEPDEMERSWTLLLDSFIRPPLQCSQVFQFFS